jgi:hypothetical protein
MVKYSYDVKVYKLNGDELNSTPTTIKIEQSIPKGLFQTRVQQEAENLFKQEEKTTDYSIEPKVRYQM